MKTAKKQRVRRTERTIAGAYTDVREIVGSRGLLRGRVKMALSELAERGPLTRDEVYDRASHIVQKNRIERHGAADKQLGLESELDRQASDVTKKLASLKSKAGRWGVQVTYIDGSGSGFPLKELGDLEDIIEKGPDWNLVKLIEIRLLDRSPIGDMEGAAMTLEDYSRGAHRDDD